MIKNFDPAQLVSLVSRVPRVSTKLIFADYLGAIKARWAINRNSYSVKPGIYAVGKPDKNADVFVTANYKLSFDTLRKNIDGLNAWILVLDTKGVNVWCAAGKGTFGTNELIHRIKDTSLGDIVTHKRLILPQLGAVGVAAHEVKKQTEFSVIYGPVRAADIKAYIAAGYKANREMRKINFTFTDRLKLIPVELVSYFFYLFAVLIIIGILSGLTNKGISFDLIIKKGLVSISNILAGYISGTVITPLLLPYIPARSFALKGFYSGVLVFFLLYLFRYFGHGYIELASWFFTITAISSFLAMMFTGASTYTSLSGVKKEMKIAVPAQISSAAIGIILFIIGKLI